MSAEITPISPDCPGAPSMLHKGAKRTICVGSHAIARCGRFRFDADGEPPRLRRDTVTTEIVCDHKVAASPAHAGGCETS